MATNSSVLELIEARDFGALGHKCAPAWHTAPQQPADQGEARKAVLAAVHGMSVAELGLFCLAYSLNTLHNQYSRWHTKTFERPFAQAMVERMVELLAEPMPRGDWVGGFIQYIDNWVGAEGRAKLRLAPKHESWLPLLKQMAHIEGPGKGLSGGYPRWL